MQLFFEGVDIAPKIGITEANIIDGAGGQLDSVEAMFTDGTGLWSRWDPQIDNSIRLAHGGFDSGVCYVDQRGQRQGLYILRGLSAPNGSKQPRSRSWEKVTLLQVAADIAAPYGLMVSPHSIQNPTYERMDQDGQTDFEFLNNRCVLEGYAVKINNKKLIIYDEAVMEAAAPVRTITKSDFCGELDFSEDQQGTCAGCLVSYGAVSGEFMVPGKKGNLIGRSDIYVTSIGEAQRFAKGLARQANRRARMLTGSVILDLKLAGSSMVRVSGVGTADGLYMVDEVEHLLVAGLSSLRLRQRLEGY